MYCTKCKQKTTVVDTRDMANKLPKHVGQTQRQFKRQKRKEFKAAREALRDLGFGCAFLPKEAFPKVSKARELIEEAYKICKPWWRKA